MAEQRQTFRFRLPWMAAPAAPTPRQASQSPSQPAAPAAPSAQVQRRPFRPAGAAPAQAQPTGQLPARAEPPPPSSPMRSDAPSRASSQSAPQRQIAPPPRGPGASPSRAVSKAQGKSQPNSPARVAQNQQQVMQSPPKSLSPSGGETQPAISIAPSSKPPITPKSAATESNRETKPQSAQKKLAAIIEIPQPQKEERKGETSQQPSQNSQLEEITTPQTDKVVETLKEQNELSAVDETKLDSKVSVPKPESKQESRKEVYEASSKEPEILKGMNHEEPEKKSFAQKNPQGSNEEMKGSTVQVLNKRGQHLREEPFHRKGKFKTFGSFEHDPKSEHFEGSTINQKNAGTGAKAQLEKEIKEDWPKVINKLGNRRDKHAVHEKTFSIITLTGENTGATMHLSSEPANRERSIHIHRGYKVNADESVGSIVNDERRSRDIKSKSTKVDEEQGKRICINNNAQGINNSLVFNSSVTERNPGAHVVLSQKAADFIKPGNEREVHETYKAEVSTTPAERLAYASNIRRRCLRGLLLESSDSDPENSEKPRRHGCRAGCTQQSKDDLTDVL